MNEETLSLYLYLSRSYQHCRLLCTSFFADVATSLQSDGKNFLAVFYSTVVLLDVARSSGINSTFPFLPFITCIIHAATLTLKHVGNSRPQGTALTM